MGAFDNRDSKRTAFFLITIFLIIIFIIAFIAGGAQGIFGVIKFLVTLLMIVGFFGFLFYIVYFLFFKKVRKDIPYMNWKTYLRSALDNGADMMNDLVLMGDKNHSAKRFMTIKGYLRIKSFDNKEYDMFVGKRRSGNPFEEYKVVLLRPEQHSDLISDVYVYGISLIMKYGYYFLNTETLDYEGIDKTMAYDTYRTLMYEMMGDMKGIVDRATNLDADVVRERQREKLLKIPVLSGQQGGGGEGNA